MANTLDPMDLKQIITLHIDGESNRQIWIFRTKLTPPLGVEIQCF
ncbi:hypothetical protein L21SP5_00787 [Salinivirga cyanobacteriivorans]|uniref:Uncharacterized protein n=1 Tax=Salinivirga cyanobacteriivorans TaxID=1307839 RepID=A0A0S2HWN3_9BACT|nr:hypothetical protein L21SP5_00787 [Salinivirga cyanobacteriivorans]